jgi:metal transporter CNNM
MLEINTPLDHRMLREIYSKGYSRIPIYEKTKNNIVGILMTRDLILVNPDKALISLKQMSSMIIREVIAVDHEDKLEPLLGYFKKGLTHIAIVTQIKDNKNVDRDPTKEVVGIVTLEDIIEEIIMDEIEDEYELLDEKNQRKILKDKLLTLFTDHEA